MASQPTLERPSPRGLYEAEADYVWNSLRRLGIPEADLEDVCQEVFMAAFERLERYDPSRAIRPWLFGIAFNLASHFHRQPRHAREVPGELPEARDESRPPDEVASAAQARKRLGSALDRIDLPRRAVVVMHEIDGLPIPEVAEALGIPVNTAYSRLRLARAELAQSVRELAGGAP